MSTMQASLPMYDFPEVREATEKWWHGIAKHMKQQGIDNVPTHLIDDVPLRQLWTSEHLLLSQCCGFDVMHSYKEHLSVLMISDWDAEGCQTGQYCSVVVVHEGSDYVSLEDLKGSTAVINDPESHSGMNTLFSSIQPFSEAGKFFKAIHVSEAHANSLKFIQDKRADVAAIDCVTFALLKRYRPSALHGIRVLCETKSAPALPYVTSINTSIDTQQRMQTALKAAFNDADLAEARETLLLSGGIFPDLSSGKHPYAGDDNPYQVIADGFTFDPKLLELLVVATG